MVKTQTVRFAQAWSYLLVVLALLLVTCTQPTNDAGSTANSTTPPAASGSADSGSANGEGDGSPPAEDRDPLRNRVNWATASEVDIFGYDIYRGDSPDGPFERVTIEPIAAAGTTDEPQKYSWIDPTNDPTKDYYYYVENISMSNQREKLTGVGHVPAKQPAAAD